MTAEQGDIDWDLVIGKIARRLARDDYPRSNLAALRRLKPEAPDGAAFWRLVADEVPALFDDERGQRVLAAVVRGMAVAHPFHLPQGGKRPLGMAMAEAGVGDARLLRLLRIGRDELSDELGRLARLMASKGNAGTFDWADAAWLLLTTGGSEAVRRRIARDFYRTLFKQTRTEDSAA
jgi:CRISPR type I-E-associated protein CasB/Cse2